MRFGVAAMHRVGGDQEEPRGWRARAGGLSAASCCRLVLPGLAAGWLYVLALCVRELSSVVLLVPPGTELVSVRVFALYQNGDFTTLSALGLTVAALLALATALAWRLGRRSLV